MRLIRNNTFNNDIVIVDGVGSSGKAMLCHIISSFDRVEKETIINLYDAIPRIYKIGKISEDAATTILKMETDKLIYYNMIGRDINFKPTDTTSVFQDSYPLRYIKRLFSEEREPSLDRIRKENSIIQILTHDGITNIDLFLKSFESRVKLLYILRNPIDLIYDWYVRGFGDRIGEDPLDIQLTYEYNGECIPLSARRIQDKYLEYDIMDRVTMMVDSDYNDDLDAYESLSEEDKKKIMIIPFDKLVTIPMPMCEKISKFLGTTPTSITEHMCKIENCPRVIDINELNRKKEFIYNSISEESKEVLDKLINRYNKYTEIK
jgi:hypothetical protein